MVEKLCLQPSHEVLLDDRRRPDGVRRGRRRLRRRRDRRGRLRGRRRRRRRLRRGRAPGRRGAREAGRRRSGRRRGRGRGRRGRRGRGRRGSGRGGRGRRDRGGRSRLRHSDLLVGDLAPALAVQVLFDFIHLDGALAAKKPDLQNLSLVALLEQSLGAALGAVHLDDAVPRHDHVGRALLPQVPLANQPLADALDEQGLLGHRAIDAERLALRPVEHDHVELGRVGRRQRPSFRHPQDRDVEPGKRLHGDFQMARVTMHAVDVDDAVAHDDSLVGVDRVPAADGAAGIQRLDVEGVELRGEEHALAIIGAVVEDDMEAFERLFEILPVGSRHHAGEVLAIQKLCLHDLYVCRSC
mmetsp:Transcript_2660/g.10332  ORF Transcript_2660/g.10332 Transcript_2660/m.10332 type:complete len:355 (+) Transcript_2660:840-1904(+)